MIEAAKFPRPVTGDSESRRTRAKSQLTSTTLPSMLKKIVIGFGLLVLIAIAVIYGNYFFWKAVNEHFAVKDVNEQHAAAEIEADEILRSHISRLQRLGILGDKIAESKADTCRLASMGAYWEQFCELYFVVGYTAPLLPSAAFARLEAAFLRKEDPSLAGDSYELYRNRCEVESSRHGNARYALTSSIPGNHDCRIPDLIGDRGPFGACRPGSTRFDYTFDPDTIDQSVDLIWITLRHRYYREHVECPPASFCVCTPRSKPIQAD